MYKYIIILVISIIVTFISFFLLIIWIGLFATDIGIAKYYNDNNNYQVIEGEIADYSFDHQYITIKVAEIDNEDFVSIYFLINGANMDVVYKNGLDDNIRLGASIEIISAPGDDGYIRDYPIAGLKINGEEYLDFEVGKQNIVDFYEEQEVKAIKYRNIILPIFVVGIFAGLYSIIKMITYKKSRDMNIYKY